MKAYIKYSYAQVFIEVLKPFNFTNGPIKIDEKTIKTLSWNYWCMRGCYMTTTQCIDSCCDVESVDHLEADRNCRMEKDVQTHSSRTFQDNHLFYQ